MLSSPLYFSLHAKTVRIDDMAALSMEKLSLKIKMFKNCLLKCLIQRILLELPLTNPIRPLRCVTIGLVKAEEMML